jgi:hypothetical protein
MNRFTAWKKIRNLRKRLWSESEPDTRWRLQSLLVTEEDELARDLELLANIDRHIADGNRRIERQRRLVSGMERDKHDGLPKARALLDRMIEGQSLHEWYRERIVIQTKQNGL